MTTGDNEVGIGFFGESSAGFFFEYQGQAIAIVYWSPAHALEPEASPDDPAADRVAAGWWWFDPRAPRNRWQLYASRHLSDAEAEERVIEMLTVMRKVAPLIERYAYGTYDPNDDHGP